MSSYHFQADLTARVLPPPPTPYFAKIGIPATGVTLNYYPFSVEYGFFVLIVPWLVQHTEFVEWKLRPRYQKRVISLTTWANVRLRVEEDIFSSEKHRLIEAFTQLQPTSSCLFGLTDANLTCMQETSQGTEQPSAVLSWERIQTSLFKQ